VREVPSTVSVLLTPFSPSRGRKINVGARYSLIHTTRVKSNKIMEDIESIWEFGEAVYKPGKESSSFVTINFA
jgi:hypothetical protein